MMPYHRPEAVDQLDLLKNSSYRDQNQDLSLMTDVYHKKKTGYLVGIFIIEVLSALSLGVLGFFLQWSDVFPVREVQFSCSDLSISLSSRFNDTNVYAFSSEALVLPLSVTIPIIVMIVGEVGIWRFGTEQPKSSFAIPVVVRRMSKVVGMFLYGFILLVTAASVTQLMVGRLRPNFLEVCKVNMTLCGISRPRVSSADQVCLEKKDVIRYARMSFPSFQSAVAIYGAVYIGVYINFNHRVNLGNILRPTITVAVLLLAVMCGLSRFIVNENHATDVIAGFVFGTFLAGYFGLYSLNGFTSCFNDGKLQSQIKEMFSDQMKILQNSVQNCTCGGSMSSKQLQIPRAQLRKTSTLPTILPKPIKLYKSSPYLSPNHARVLP